MAEHRLTYETGIRPRHRLDIVWWLVTGTLAWTVTRIPDIYYPGDQGTPQFLSHSILFLVGGLVGACRSERPWRWGVAAFLALALGDICQVGNGSYFPEVGLSHLWMHCRTGAADWALHALRVLVGAYAGAFLVNKGLR